MNKEIVNETSIRLRREHIFESNKSRALTPLGSCFEGIQSIKRYLISLESSNLDIDGKPICSDEKRKEWVDEIDGKFKEIGDMLEMEIPSDENVRSNLIWQHSEIVNKQLDTLHGEVILMKGQK